MFPDDSNNISIELSEGLSSGYLKGIYLSFTNNLYNQPNIQVVCNSAVVLISTSNTFLSTYYNQELL